MLNFFGSPGDLKKFFNIFNIKIYLYTPTHTRACICLCVCVRACVRTRVRTCVSINFFLSKNIIIYFIVTNIFNNYFLSA